MIFSSDSPLSQQYIKPNFASGATRSKLALAGYDQTGQQTGWGKISSWIPGVGVALNYAAKGIAKHGGAGDTFSNIQEDTDNRWLKLGLEGAAATAAFGGLGVLGAGAASGIGGAGGAAAGATAAGSGSAGALGAGGTSFLGGLFGSSKDMLSNGLQAGLKFGGGLAFDQNDLVTEGQYIYR